MRKNILNAFLFVFLSFTLISCGMGNTVDETAQNTTPDAIIKELLSISAVSQGGTSYKFTPNVYGASLAELTYMWTFGDSGKSSEQSPVYTYDSTGPKTVTLTTYKGEDIWKTTSTAINVTDAGSITGVDIIAKPAADGINYTFTSRAVAADGGDLNFTWNFNDDADNEITGSNLNNVTHSFTQYDRSYNVTLTVKNPANNDVVTTKVAIKTPTPTFSFDVNAGAIPGSKRFVPKLSIEIPDVKYKWYFDVVNYPDNKSYIAETYGKNGETEFYYGTSSGAVTVRCVVSSSKLANDIIKEVSSIDTSINFQLIAGSYVATSEDQLTFKYSVKGAFQGADANKITGVKYKFNFADGSSEEVTGTEVSDGGKPIAGQSQAEVTHTYKNYLENYVVSVEAIDSKGSSLGVLSNGLSHSFVVPKYTINVSTASNDPFSVTLSVISSYELKGSVYSWNVGDSDAGVKQGESVTHKYSSNGTFPITLTVKSNAGGFINYTATSSVEISENISDTGFTCAPKAGDENWLKYVCRTNASSTAGTLEYTWKVDGETISTNPGEFEYIYGQYGRTYNIDLELKIAGTEITANPERQQVITPRPIIEIWGNVSNVHKDVTENYNITFRVNRDNDYKHITLENPTIRWTFEGNQLGEFNDKTEASYAFTLAEGQNSATKQIDVVASGSNLNGEISSYKYVGVIRPDSEMADVTNTVLTCEDDSAWNTVKKRCKVTFDINNAVNPEEQRKLFRVKIVDRGNLNPEQIVEHDQWAYLTLTWPDLSVSGKSDNTKTFTIDAQIYKVSDPNNSPRNLEKNVSVTNYIYYALFPMPERDTGGGTGSQIGVYSCGYSSFYSNGYGLIQRRGCGEGDAISGGVVKGTLNLGPLIDGSYNATRTFRMVWGVRIPNVGEREIKSGYVNQGQPVSHDLMTFDISSAFNGVQYAGAVYNDDDNKALFFLRITDALSKPLTVWYSGNYIKDDRYKNYKLEILAPIQEAYGHSCRYSFSGNTVYGDQLYVKFRQPYFNNGSGNFNLWFAGDIYAGSNNQHRPFGGGGFPSINSGNQTVGIQNLWYTEGDDSVKINSVRNVTISVTLQNSLSGGTYEYKNVYKGITCN